MTRYLLATYEDDEGRQIVRRTPLNHGPDQWEGKGTMIIGADTVTVAFKIPASHAAEAFDHYDEAYEEAVRVVAENHVRSLRP